MGLGELYLLTYMPAAVSMSKDNNFVLGVDPKSKDWNDVDMMIYFSLLNLQINTVQ